MKLQFILFVVFSLVLLQCTGQPKLDISGLSQKNTTEQDTLVGKPKIVIQGDGIVAYDRPKLKTKIDKKVADELTLPIKKALTKSDSIELFQVEGFVSSNEAVPTLEKYKILHQMTLKTTEANALKKVLADSATYLPTDDVKYCLFVPNMGIRLSQGKDKKPLTILVSFVCDMVKYTYEGKSVALNSDPGKKALKVFYDKLLDSKPIATTEETKTPPTTEASEPTDEETATKKIKETTETSKKTVAKETEKKATTKSTKAMGVDVSKKIYIEGLGKGLVKNRIVGNINTRVYYQVKSNDGWRAIARKLNTEYDLDIAPRDLWELNDLNDKEAEKTEYKNYLKAGDDIIIGYIDRTQLKKPNQ